MNTYGSMNGWQVQVARGTVRIGDRERDDAAQALGEHFAQGRLAREEYDDRLALVFGARTWSDLTPIFGDLPGPKPGQPAPTVHQLSREAFLARRRPRFPFFPVFMILFGAAILTGHWWVFWLGFGAVMLYRRMQWHGHRSRHQSSGSWRTPRGTWV
jgi:hypothetical protein